MEDQVEIVETRSMQNEMGFGSRLLRFILRLLVVAIVGAGIGIGAYYGVPTLYRDFIEPIRSNSERVAALEESVARIQVDFREQHSELSSDLAAIEGGIAQQREDLAELTAVDEGLNTRLENLATALEDVQPWSDQIKDLEEENKDLESRLSFLEESLQEEDPPFERLQQQIQLLRAMELVTRARLWMIQGNLGMASDDLTLAKEILETVELNRSEEESLSTIIVRLDQVLLEISLNPIIAADDLEIVWQLLLLATEP